MLETLSFQFAPCSEKMKQFFELPVGVEIYFDFFFADTDLEADEMFHLISKFPLTDVFVGLNVE